MAPPVDPARYSAFLVAMAFMAISPGPANLFFIRTGLGGRPMRVLAGVIGTNSATLVWFIAAALGLQALMAAFPLAFRLLALAGGLYVGWLGFSTFRAALKLDNERLDNRFTAPPDNKTLWQTLREGFMVQILNPKALLFFTAVLPPFLDVSRPMTVQMPVFAVTAIGMDIVSMSTYGLLAVRLSQALRDPHNKQRFDLGAGVVLMLISLLILVHAVGDLLKTH